MTKKNRQITLGAISCFLIAVLFGSCTKTQVEPTEIYPDPPPVLVKFLDGGPYPSTGSEGSVVKFNVTGLKGKEGQFKFFVHLTEAEIISVEETAITVKVPLGASTGAANVLINGQYYFGPTFVIKGKLSIDASFNTDAYVSNGAIHGIFLRSDNTSYFLYGRFSNYQNSATAANPITNMAIVDLNCAYKAVADQMKVGKTGVAGSLSSVIQQPGGQYLLAGAFGSYDTTNGINNITRLTSTGALETQVVDLINPDPVNFPNDGQATVASFNGGTLGGGITKMFLQPTTGDVTVVGNFAAHVSTFYERSTKTGPFVDLVKVRQLIRMKSSGAFDSSFNFNYAANEGYEGGNGFIYDAVQLNDGKIILVGNFTTYNGTSANYIVRINATNGLVDPTFNMGGIGADAAVNKIRYNAVTNKILLVGEFKKYNGQDANGVVMINPDGSMDTNFRFGKATGVPEFAAQLNNGKIIVAGTFSHYNYNYLTAPEKNIVRPGFMVLESNGALAPGYNNTGLFRGVINDLVQITINGVPGVILVGDFDRFDGKTVGDIVKLRMEN